MAANASGLAADDRNGTGASGEAEARVPDRTDAARQVDFVQDPEVINAEKDVAEAEEKLRNAEARAASLSDADRRDPGLIARIENRIKMAKAAVQMARQRLQAVWGRKNGGRGFGSSGGVAGKGVSGGQKWTGSSGAAGKNGGLQKNGNPDIMKPETPAARERYARTMKAIFEQSWVGLLEESHLESIKQVLFNATEKELLFWRRHGGLIQGDFYSGEGPHYKPNEKKVFMDIRKPKRKDIRLNQSMAITGFFHEVGHLFDWRAFKGTRLRDELGDFDALLASDYLVYANKVLEAAGEETLTGLIDMSTSQKQALNDDLSVDIALKTSIADIVGGLTKRDIGWGHKKDYWGGKKPMVEAIAHMFEARMMKGERLDMMRIYFPNAYRQFEETIRQLERSGK